jgi:hypothetical protein
MIYVPEKWTTALSVHHGKVHGESESDDNAEADVVRIES